MKRIFFAALICTLSTIAFAQKKFDDNSLLWKISGKDLKQPSYLFGTIHMICADDYLWTDAMKDAFDKTQELYLELPMAEEDFQQQMMQHLMLTDGKQLKDFFSEEQYKKLDLFFKDSMKMPLSAFNKMKPFGIMSFALLKYMDCNGEMPTAYETKIIGYAIEKNLVVKGFETIEEQMQIFDNMPKDTMAKMVMSTIEDMPKNKKIFDAMMKAYKSQNLTDLHKEIVQSPEYAAHLNALLYDRNARWVPKIIAAAKEKPTFFAVGAGHLPGSKGVINLLKKQGYTVTPVK